MEKQDFLRLRKQVLLVCCEMINIDDAQANEKRQLEEFETKLKLSSEIDNSLLSEITDLLNNILKNK